MWTPFVLALIVLSQSCTSGREEPITSSKPHYTITVNEKNIRQIAVNAVVPLSTDTLVMSQIMSESLEGGYADFCPGP